MHSSLAIDGGITRPFDTRNGFIFEVPSYWKVLRYEIFLNKDAK